MALVVWFHFCNFNATSLQKKTISLQHCWPQTMPRTKKSTCSIGGFALHYQRLWQHFLLQSRVPQKNNEPVVLLAAFNATSRKKQSTCSIGGFVPYFLIELLKSEPSIIIANTTNTKQIILAKESIPMSEEAFKKFFMILMNTNVKENQTHIIIGCHILSECMLKDIKFDCSKPQLMEWMKKEKIFTESDTLGIAKITTIGYLMKIHPHLVNQNNLNKLLQTELDDVKFDANLAVELDPMLQTLQTDVMTNGDMFIPEIPPFELYKTKISHGTNKSKIATDIIGIKCAADKVHLLKEYFSQLASPESYEKQIGVFVLTGAVHLLGAVNYAKLLCCDYNAFLQNVVTIPIGDLQHMTLNIPFSLHNDTDIDKTTLDDLICDQPWCYSIEHTNTPTKILLVTKNQSQTSLQVGGEYHDGPKESSWSADACKGSSGF